MNAMVDRETSDEVNAVAALWAVRAEENLLNAHEKAELQAWLDADIRHLGAYARASAMLAEASRVKALGSGFDPDIYRLEHGELIQRELGNAIPFALPTRRRFLAGGSALAAAGAVAVVGLSWPAAATTYSTKRGEIRLVPLPDGSSMTLNTETTAKARFTRSERHIELISGEALFDIARDLMRPFVVDAGSSRLTAATTSFTVSRLAGKDVSVTVRQGRVELFRQTSPRSATLLSANTRALVAPGAGRITTTTLAPSEISQDLAWQQGMLSFADTPLRQAAAQFARYSDVAIRFDNPEIADETVTGLYAANDPQGFARSAALSLGLTSTAQSDSVLLSRK